MLDFREGGERHHDLVSGTSTWKSGNQSVTNEVRDANDSEPEEAEISDG